MKARFRLTYDIVTDASSRNGDSAFRGFLPRSKDVPRRNHTPKRPSLFTLKDAFELVYEQCELCPCEADSCPVTVPRWIQSTHTNERGESVTLAVHIGKDVSPSSAYRIARLFRVYGLRAPGAVAA